MFITLKSRKSRAKGEMEQVALKDASTGNAIPQNMSTKRRPACVACHNRKLRCTGSVTCCDRCKSRRITCVAVKRPSPTITSEERSKEQSVGSLSDADSTHLFDLNDVDPSLTEHSTMAAGEPGSLLESHVLPSNSASLGIMQQLMGGVHAQHLTPSATVPSSTGSATGCSCTQNVVQVLSNIEEDQFKLTQLSLDQVVQLQKWLMYQCCTALECPQCHGERSVHTILVLICERILLMYECSAARIAKAAHIHSAEGTRRVPPKGTDDYASYYSPESNGVLFCGISGVPMETAPCQGGICSPEQGSQYSIEEQVCMVHALMKLHMKSFRSLLDWISGTCEEFGNEARRGRIEALGARLSKAAEHIDASAGMVMNRPELVGMPDG